MGNTVYRSEFASIRSAMGAAVFEEWYFRKALGEAAKRRREMEERAEKEYEKEMVGWTKIEF